VADVPGVRVPAICEASDGASERTRHEGQGVVEVTVLGEWNVMPPPFAPTQPTFERHASPFITPVDASRIMTTTNPTKEKIVFIGNAFRRPPAISFRGPPTAGEGRAAY
jgi:hypothetical protein